MFVDISPPSEPDIVIEEVEKVKLSQVLDVLMERSEWKVITAPSMPFEPDYEVAIDLSMNYVQILEALKDHINIEYREAKCEGCYEIQRMTSR